MTESTEAESRRVESLLQRWAGGDRQALDELLTCMYRDIHAIAVRELRHERHLTIRPTALVSEAFMRLATLKSMRWNDRAHFLSMAARVTRQALIDEARQRRADKRNGGERVTLSDLNIGAADTAHDAIDVDTLLNELQGYD